MAKLSEVGPQIVSELSCAVGTAQGTVLSGLPRACLERGQVFFDRKCKCSETFQ